MSRGECVLLFAFLLLAASCDPVNRARGTVVYASGADLESANPLVTIHPLARQIQRYALFVTLVRYDSALRIVPYYARSWKWSRDRRTLVLRLTSGLRWQDGVATTASDVAFTLSTARDRRTGYPRYADLADVVRARALDDSTVAIEYARSQPGVPPVLAELPIVPAHRLARVPPGAVRRAAFDTAPVGNGPFRFVDRRANQWWIFERNANFPAALGGPPAVRRLVVAVVDEAATKFAGLVSGELDVAGISPTMVPLARRDPSLRVLDYPVLMTYGIVLNTARPPFDDPRVRRAVNLAIDRGRIMDVALGGFAAPAAGPVPPDHPYAASALLRRDTAAAGALLEAAGWRRTTGGVRRRGGMPLRVELLTVGSANNAVEQLIQADLAAVGIRMEIRQREMAAFLSEARASPRRFDALLTGIPGDLSLGYISAMFDSRQAGGALDYGGYHRPTLDTLLARARVAPEGPSARAAWGAVQRALAEQLPVVWLYHARGVQGLSRRLRGVRMDLRGELATLSQWSVGAPAGR